MSAAGSGNRILTMGNLNKFFLQLLSVAGSCNRIWMMGNSVHDTPFPSSREETLGAGGGSKFYMQIKLISVYLICSMSPAPSRCVSSQLGYFYVLFMIDIFSRSTAVWLLFQCLVISYFLEEATDHLCISNFLK